MPALPDVAAVLAGHGLAPGPDGYALAELEGMAEARGWRCAVEDVERPTRWTRYRARVWLPTDPVGPRGTRRAMTLTARGRGTTAAGALAQALAKALTGWPG